MGFCCFRSKSDSAFKKARPLVKSWLPDAAIPDLWLCFLPFSFGTVTDCPLRRSQLPDSFLIASKLSSSFLPSAHLQHALCLENIGLGTVMLQAET